IGETIADKVTGKALPSIKVEEPTVKMAFSINTSPFVVDILMPFGKYVTSRNLRDKLYRELEQNLAIKAEKMVKVKQPIHSLSNTQTIDFTDAVGSNIRIDSRGPGVMRTVPCLNEVRF
ncbi:GTP-binding protein TypA, partial [Trifolium pratense]